MRDLYLTGNNDGDYIHIKQYNVQEKEYTCFIEIGHCGVVIARHQIPTELISNLFHKKLMQENGDMSKVVESTLANFDRDFIAERTSKVRKWK